jgi:hypothetical protein
MACIGDSFECRHSLVSKLHCCLREVDSIAFKSNDLEDVKLIEQIEFWLRLRANMDMNEENPDTV